MSHNLRFATATKRGRCLVFSREDQTNASKILGGWGGLKATKGETEGEKEGERGGGVNSRG